MKQQDAGNTDAACLIGGLDRGVGNRERYWSECSIEEKIERIRQQTKAQQESIERIGNTLSTIARQFGTHQHNDSGLILIPIAALEYMEKEIAALGYVRPRRTDNQEVYF